MCAMSLLLTAPLLSCLLSLAVADTVLVVAGGHPNTIVEQSVELWLPTSNTYTLPDLPSNRFYRTLDGLEVQHSSRLKLTLKVDMYVYV